MTVLQNLLFEPALSPSDPEILCPQEASCNAHQGKGACVQTL